MAGDRGLAAQSHSKALITLSPQIANPTNTNAIRDKVPKMADVAHKGWSYMRTDKQQ